MINKSKDLWQLDLKDIQRIKSGILKYIGGNQVPKSRDKNSRTPSEPKTPKRVPNKQGKKSSSNIQSNLSPPSPFRLEKQQVKDKIPNNGQIQPMPKGFWRTKNGKIMKTQEGQKESMDQLANMLNLSNKKFNSGTNIKKGQQNKKQKNISQNQANILQSPKIIISQVVRNEKQHQDQENQKLKQAKLQNKIKTDVSGETILTLQMKENQVNLKPLQNIQENSVQPLKTGSCQQDKSLMSVSQIAKLFGGSKNKNNVLNQTIKFGKEIQKKEFSTRPAPINIQKEDSKFQLKKNQQDQNRSFSSFGKYQRKVAPFRKATISEFLGIEGQKPWKQKEGQKTRKRSHTFQKDIPQLRMIEGQRKNENDGNTKYSLSGNKKNKNESKFGTKVQPFLNNFKLEGGKQIQQVQIIFTQEQQQELKSKYNALSLRLDKLKERVIEQSKNAVGSKRNIDSPSYKRIQAIMLYNMYSPLRVLQKKRQQKKRQYDKQISLTHRPRKLNKRSKSAKQRKDLLHT